MPNTLTIADPVTLLEKTETALAITGLPRFRSADEPNRFEELGFIPTAGDHEDPCWALAPVDGPRDEFVAVDTEMASVLVMSHFRTWLLDRGWQVQVHCYSSLRRWTLVDCLSAADGGGDRLDVDYPYGEDELSVLVDAVIAVNTI